MGERAMVICLLAAFSGMKRRMVAVIHRRRVRKGPGGGSVGGESRVEGGLTSELGGTSGGSELGGGGKVRGAAAVMGGGEVPHLLGGVEWYFRPVLNMGPDQSRAQR